MSNERDMARYHEQHRDDPEEWEARGEMVMPQRRGTSSKEQDREMLRAALARLRRDLEGLDHLIAADAPQRDLVCAICDLAYASGTVQGAAALYIGRWVQPDGEAWGPPLSGT